RGHKEGKRNSASDAERLQKAHDLLVENGAQCTLKVFKGEDGNLRWVTVSSTAFRDRDNEIVSTKALDEDVTLSDQTKEYGPLRWWHVDGLDLGKCDYNAMSGRMLIESGTFDNDAIGNSIKEAADELAVSIGFVHPPTEPDADGVFHHIRRFERSLLPAGKASNLFTQLAVAKEKTDMTLFKEKFDELAKLIGKEQAETLTKKTDETEKAAEAAGVTFKAESDKAGTDGAEEGLPTTMKGFSGAVLKCMKEFTDTQAEHGKSLKAFGDWQAAHDKSHGEKKEADPVAEKAAQESAAEIALLKEAVTTATARIAELEGSTPRSAKGFRPTQEASTLHKGEDPQGPQPNEAFKDFTSWMVTGSGGAQPK
ncbi:MAG TPA: hypothetical protein VMQ76_01355, partial [Terracidiphilus sp.]|nr:hypothetical protein [Terracidiphilus sp.]